MNRSATTSRTRTSGAATPAAEGAVRFSLGNWILLLAGLVAVLGGFALLSSGSIVAAPLLLMLGYLVLIPWGIIK
jgi:hypothetical protein